MNMRVSDEAIKLSVPPPQVPAKQPTQESSSSPKPVSAILSESLPALLGQLQQINADSADDVDKKTREIKDLIKGNPNAVPLLLAENAARQQRAITMLRADPSKAVDPAPALTQTIQELLAPYQADLKSMSLSEHLDVMDTFTKILVEAKADTVDVDSDILGKYAKFMSALSEFMTGINAARGTKGQKITLDDKTVFKLFDKFINKWYGQSLAEFQNEQDAVDFAKRFRGNTVKVVADNGKWSVCFDLSALNPVIDVIAGDYRYDLLDLHITAKEYLKQALATGEYQFFIMVDGQTPIRKELDSASSQTLQLATNDVQKTFQTDLDLQINGFSRSNSQFDNLTKLVTALAATLTDICKGFLTA